MASKVKEIDKDTPITVVYKDYLKHLKKDHPQLYIKVKETVDWYRPPVN